MQFFIDDRAADFLHRTVAQEDDLLRRVAGHVERERLPRITAEAGRFLQWLVATIGARRVLEVGTCLAYSAIWIGRGLPPNGQLESLELNPGRADQARRFIHEAGLRDRVTITLGDAHLLLPQRPHGAFDLVFVDAEKEGMEDYLRQGVRLLRPGGVLAVDNAFWHGTVFDEQAARAGAPEMRAFVAQAARHPELDTTILPLGDGLLVARRRGPGHGQGPKSGPI